MTGLTPEVLARLAAAAGLEAPSVAVERAGIPEHGVTLDARRAIYPASMIKVAIALALADGRSRNERSLDELVTIGPGVITANDAPSRFVLGAEVSLGEALGAMLSASDNVATNLLIDELGRESIGAACRPYGAELTEVRRKLSGGEPLIADPQATGRNAHPAFDAARLFAEIERRERAGDRTLWDPLATQIWNGKLSRGWWPGDRFAHKTGDTDSVSHDGGILETPSGARYVIVVYTELPSNEQTDAKFARFASRLRPYLETLRA